MDGSLGNGARIHIASPHLPTRRRHAGPLRGHGGGRDGRLDLHLGCNSIEFFLVSEPAPRLVWSFEICLNLKCPSTESGPELGAVSRPVSSQS